MPTVLDCPACSRKLRVTDDLIGHMVRCPTCGDTFTVAATASGSPGVGSPSQDIAQAPAPVSEEKHDDVAINEPEAKPERPRPPARSRSRNEIDCPRCGESISARTERCRFCGERLQEREDEEDDEGDAPSYRRRVRRDWEPHRGTIVLVLGILSIVIGVIGLFMGIAAWVMGSTDLKKMNRREMDPEGRGITQAGWICGIIGTIWQGIMSLGCVAYFIFIAVMFSAMGPGGFAPPTPTKMKGATIQTPKAPKNVKPGQAPPGFNGQMDRDDDDDEDK
jgi:predicted Zn finger-like uncharacterized protein